MEEISQEQWEAICRRCGKCCYEKVDLGAGVVRYTDQPCEHLDTATNLCKVYSNRHELEPDCIMLTEHLVRTLPWLPEDCAYLEYVRHKDTLAAVRAVQKRKTKHRRPWRNR
jgi:uncharacterized cysteine cluster protein YcgN (CxxCxxCC family)